MVLNRYPAGFQIRKSGCASFLVLVQRTIRVCAPRAGSVNCVCHCRKLYVPWSIPSWVGRQLLPPSIDRSTRATPASARGIAFGGDCGVARVEAGVPAGTLSPLRMLVMNDRGAL